MRGIALLTVLALACSAHAAPTSEQASLALVLTQLDQMQSTLQRAQAQADEAPTARFFFDYSQASVDIQVMRNGINNYLTPTRAQPRNMAGLSGLYRREGSSDE